MFNKLALIALAAAALSVVASLVGAWPLLSSHFNLPMGFLAAQIVLILGMILGGYRKVKRRQPIQEAEVLLIAVFFLGTWSQGIAILLRLTSH